jgi:aspartate racemase
MKTLGIIGGIGPESTIAYYRAIFASYRARPGTVSAPSIIINSIDVDKLLNLVASDELDALTTYLVEEIERLARAGATLGILAANTPHIVFDDVFRRSPIPLVSIVDATADAAEALGLKRLALFGTRFTMGARFYPDVFAQRGIDVVAPSADDQAYIHEKYTTELLRNLFLPTTREGLIQVIARWYGAALDPA